MAVLRPLKLVIENYPGGRSEELDAVNNPEDPAAGTRRIPFGRELYIERDDFMEDPPKNFYRLAPGREVRLRYAYFVTCREVVKDAAGEIVELRCTYDPATRGGNAPGRAQGARHDPLGVGGARHAGRDPALQPAVHPARSRRRRRSDGRPQPAFARSAARAPWSSPALAGDNSRGDRCSSSARAISAATPTRAPGRLVFNRTIGLRDSWARTAGG